MDVTDRPSLLTDSPSPCYFCGAGEDSAEHVYGECVVVRSAWAGLAKMLGCKLTDDFAVTLLSFPRLDNPAVAVAIVCFNWAVWTERTDFLSALGRVPAASYVVNRILLRAQRRVPADKQRCTARGELTVRGGAGA